MQPLVFLEAIPKPCGLCFIRVSRHLKTIKALMIICFSVSGYPDEALAQLALTQDWH